MSQAQITQLVHAISSDHVIAFFLVMARITPLFILAPIFSSPMLIPRVRAMLAVMLSFALTPLAAHGQHIPNDALAIVGLMLEGLVVGFAFAFALACVFAAVQGAGVLADSLSGFSFGATIDPINGNQGGSLTNFYSVVGVALFLAIGGDAWMMRGLATTFRIVPISSGPHVTSVVAGATQMFGSVFVGAIEVAAPVMLALVISDVAFGMVSKVVPQLNVFAVGFPVKVGVALIVVMASLPFIGSWISGQLYTTVGTAVHSLQIG
jgi:flagellar biosynthetic protein FliR